MTDETIVAVYDSAAHADAAAASLKSAGIAASAITLHAATATTPGAPTGVGQPAREQGFWSNLFGGEPDHDTAVYDRSLQGGSTVVSVKASEAHVARITDILESHHPIDIDERLSGYGGGQTTITTTTTTARQPVAGTPAGVASRAATDVGDRMQLSEESLVVGKRVVNRGGTRIRRFVVETPVEQSVSLHGEKVTLERHAVNDGRPVTDSFSEKTMEMTESAEEAVVAKTAHVYEEVGLNKTASDRVETVHDTVRKEEVEIEQVPGTGTTAATDPLSSRPKPKV